MDTCADLLDSFVTALEPLGVLDRFQLAGVIASWWGSAQYDIRTLSFHRFSGVVQGWLTTIEVVFAHDGEDDLKDRQRQATEASGAGLGDLPAVTACRGQASMSRDASSSPGTV